MSDQMRHSTPSVVELHIGELLLEGFPAMDRTQLEAVVQQELTRLFADRGVSAALSDGGAIASLDGGEFHMASGANTQVIGVQIARAVYGGLHR